VVRLWLDGSAASGAHAGSDSRLDAHFIQRFRRVVVRYSQQALPAESQAGQEIEPRLRQEVLAERRQEIRQKVRQEERQEIGQEVSQEGRPGFGSKELAPQVIRQEERAAIRLPEGREEGAGRPEALTRPVSPASPVGPRQRHS
jgi:hypothetical protein